MKKFYSLVLMATALLIGTNAWARTITVGNAGSGAEKTSLSEAFGIAVNGDEIKLLTPITISTAADLPIWIGEADMAEESGYGKKLTLDLNGQILKRQVNRRLFDISHGELTIKTSLPGGEIQDGTYTHNTDDYAYEDLIILAGSILKDNNPKTQSNYYSHLVVENGVTITANQNAIVVDASNILKASSKVSSYHTINYSTQVYGGKGVAHGVRIDVKGKLVADKYAIKANGNLGSPFKNADKELNSSKIEGYTVTDQDLNYSPYIYVHSTGELHTAENSTKAAAAYSSGYARWRIEGYCGGSTGLYAKSGEIELVDAVIESTCTNHTVPQGKSAGVNAGGSAIVVESNASFVGGTSITISGDTKVTASGGYAIEEKITTSAGSKVDNVTIAGGTLEGGSAGAIYVEDATKENDKVSVIGGNVSGDVATTTGTTTITELIPSAAEVHTTTVVVNGKPVVVISDGKAPADNAKKAAWDDVELLSNKENPVAAAWTAVGTGTIENGKTIYLGELQMISGTAADAMQVLTIESGACLDVKHLMMNNFAQIIVEAGAKLIVEGEQGIVAPVVSNIVLQNEGSATLADRKHAIFLFNPAVTSNKHPNATVELTTYSFVNSGSDYQWERFGVPTWNELKSISSTGGVATRFQVYEGTGWKELGFLDSVGKPIVKAEDLMKPFATYNLLAYRKSNATPVPTYTFAGELVGNMDAELNVTNYWTGFTNSYSANLNIPALFDAVKDASIVDEFIYVAIPQGNGSYTWDPVDDAVKGFSGMKLLPMQAFILKKVQGSTATESVAMNYNDMVYQPGKANAPARRMASSNDFTARVRVVVMNENGAWDNVKLRETETRTKEAEKYMNDDVNIYAMGVEKSAIFAVEDLNNSYLGFSTVKGGNFTINFADVEGREFTLVDHETGARVAMVEGNAYEFTAAANSVNDYRFEVVESAKLPTAIENTEAVKSAKGIYTITGQFVGEMNVWNTLPAGIYVVNGEKRVK